MRATIVHNPNCSTSKEVLKLLRENRVYTTVINYLEEPLNMDELKGLLSKLDIKADGLIRKREKEASLIKPEMTENEKLEIIMEHPILIERPIVITPKHAKICRPAKVVLELIEQGQ
jgi:arsenate reductase